MRVAVAREQLGDEAPEEVGGRGALRGALVQHAHHERLELLRVVAADGLEHALRDLIHQRRQVRAFRASEREDKEVENEKEEEEDEEEEEEVYVTARGIVPSNVRWRQAHS